MAPRGRAIRTQANKQRILGEQDYQARLRERLLNGKACRAIQHAFSNPSLVNLISKDANLVSFISLQVVSLFKISDYDAIIAFRVDSMSSTTPLKSATS